MIRLVLGIQKELVDMVYRNVGLEPCPWYTKCIINDIGGLGDPHENKGRHNGIRATGGHRDTTNGGFWFF